jgi:asparagine synthetase B (glutamine-hydrolysing)
MNFRRDWLSPPTEWFDPAQSSGLSREDVAVFLGRGTPRRFRTLMSNVRRLPPGHEVRDPENGSLHLIRTWSALQRGSSYLNLGLEERAAELRNLLLTSVRNHCAGKKVGLLLSGGYDSTLIATLLVREGIRPQCYTVEAPGRYPSEWQHSRETAERLNIPIRKVVVTLEDLLRTSAEMWKVKASPNVCWVIANQAAASVAAREDDCDILILGTGSDELFGPSEEEAQASWNFDREIRSSGEAVAWSVLLGDKCERRTALLFKGNISPFEPEQLQRLFPDLDTTALLETDIVDLYRELHREAPNLPFCSLTLQLELEMRSADVILDELTSASLLSGVPVAFPFYDHAVVELAAGTPLEHKVNQGSLRTSSSEDVVDWQRIISKYILRYAFKEIIPDSVNKRPRLAYTLPFSWWMKGEAKKSLVDQIQQSSIWEDLKIQRDVLREFTEEDLGEGNPWRGPLRFWLLYQLAVWAERMKHQPPQGIATTNQAVHLRSM